jgi:hypothetical protein
VATKKKPTQDPAELTAEGAGSVDQIRDILFGPQIREIERKLARLEERLAKEAADLRGDFKQRLEALENFARDEVEVVSQSIEGERKDRVAAINELTAELKRLANETEKRLAKLDEQAKRAHKDLRQAILDQNKRLGDEIQTKHESLSQTLDRDVSELRNDKADREGLAALFTELALRIKGDPLLPGEE